jgi:hypothetical protein
MVPRPFPVPSLALVKMVLCTEAGADRGSHAGLSPASTRVRPPHFLRRAQSGLYSKCSHYSAHVQICAVVLLYIDWNGNGGTDF